MEVRIKPTENGYVILWDEKDDDGTKIERSLVVEVSEEGDEKRAEAEALASVFYILCDVLGYSHSKHDKYRLFIAVDEDDKLRNLYRSFESV